MKLLPVVTAVACLAVAARGGWIATDTAPPLILTPDLKVDTNDCLYSPEDHPDLLSTYDVGKVLQALGGAPGEVSDAEWSEIPEPSNSSCGDTSDNIRPEQRESLSGFSQYVYRATDEKTFIRLERAVRARGAVLYASGEVWWAAPDLCGRALRHAEYHSDGAGLHANVTQEHCTITPVLGGEERQLICYGPHGRHCEHCKSVLPGTLMASLVG